ncbi:hypothetical protein L596_024201 [Steinernema carpocapsae]|uniref:Uncharacterized protein n=1 Tax=Steinernema carpocapsae TaxID=34508 RepID=A0A4V5ZZN3_STECR|nr:hypothetical protein L596_024201 [Steinernema carpocapsae]
MPSLTANGSEVAKPPSADFAWRRSRRSRKKARSAFCFGRAGAKTGGLSPFCKPIDTSNCQAALFWGKKG